MTVSYTKILRGLLLAIITFAALVAFTSSRAAAVTEAELLTQFGSQGSGAGQFGGQASNIAADPVTGHLFVTDSGNARVDEFTAWGVFVKAFGWDVAPGAVDEAQEVTVRATTGQFRLSFGASTTIDLDRGAPASGAEGPDSVEAALNDLPSIASGGGSVSVARGPSDSSSTRYVVTFSAGPLAATDVEQLSAEDGTTPLTGGNPVSSVAVSTRADGTAAGSGLESCTAASGCQRGLEGSGAGALALPWDLAVDASGSIYVRDVGSDNDDRIQKFDSAGRFLFMVGGGVNKTTGGDFCSAASGDECGAGSPGTGERQFSSLFGLAVDQSGTLLAGDQNRIQELGPDGTFKGEIPIPGESVRWMAFDASSNSLHVVFAEGGSFTKANVVKLDRAGTQTGALAVPNEPGPIAADGTGNVYAVDRQTSRPKNLPERFLKFDASGAQSGEFLREELAEERLTSFFRVQALATNTAGDLYASSMPGASFKGGILKDSFIRAYGPPPVKFEPPPPRPPTIAAQYAVSVNPDDALVRGEINPHFFSDATYYVEYGTGKCSAGGCDRIQPLAPGAKLSVKPIDVPVVAGVLLEGLQPATTYNFRFVAQSSGGGPVRGVGGEVGGDGSEGSFRTFARPLPPATSCSNQGFRTGLSAQLPDCRAFEMVSPVDKNNGDVLDLLNTTSFRTGLQQGSLSGNAFTYSSYRAFADPQAAPYTSQYFAGRDPQSGWSSKALSTRRSGPGFYAGGVFSATENEFKAFSPDLCSAWLVTQADPPLAPGAIEGFPNLYRRDNCTGTYEALSTVKPPGLAPGVYRPEPQGYSAGGSSSVFRVGAKLTPDASSGVNQLYEASGGALKLVCILPNGTPFAGDCSAGTPGSDPHRTGSLSHAISADGSRIYWSAQANESAPGKIYLRVDGETTLAVSETSASTQPAQFWGASADGSRALFTLTAGPKAGNLYEYDLGEEASALIAAKVEGVAGSSEDLASYYFVSREALGGEGAGGEPNLYLRHEGSNTLVATLSGVDVTAPLINQAVPSNTSAAPIYHAARVSEDGLHLAFVSNKSLTGYDNTDVKTGEPDSEIYVYAAESEELVCASCNPSGARPVGRRVTAPVGGTLATAAAMPSATYQSYIPRALAADGSRLFFTSYDALVPNDTNGKADVYEWERAGSGSCEESSLAFSAANAGCIYLISSGESPSDSALVDISHDGRDAFFTTTASLLPQDSGLIDVYDAREGGGFSPPARIGVGCEGEACQGPLSAPDDPTPASSSFQGAGNVVEKPAKRKHRKKFHRKKSHKQSHKQSRQAKGDRRAAR